MTIYELSQAVVKAVPTEHLMEKCMDGSGDLSSYLDVGTVVQVRGVLVLDRDLHRPCKLYLDFDGIGRFVLAQEGEKFVGVTFIPRFYRQDSQASEPLPVED